MDMLNVIIILLSNQAVNISFHVLWLLIFRAFLLMDGFSSRFIWKYFSLFITKAIVWLLSIFLKEMGKNNAKQNKTN